MKWNYCSEKLPSDSRQVLIAIKWSKYGDIEVSLGEYWGEEEGWGKFDLGVTKGEVMAWAEKPTFEGRDCLRCRYGWEVEKHDMCEECGYNNINNFDLLETIEDERRSRRAAYAEGITSEEYIETGEPQLKFEEDEDIIIETDNIPLEDNDTIIDYNIKIM